MPTDGGRGQPLLPGWLASVRRRRGEQARGHLLRCSIRSPARSLPPLVAPLFEGQYSSCPWSSSHFNLFPYLPFSLTPHSRRLLRASSPSSQGCPPLPAAPCPGLPGGALPPPCGGLALRTWQTLLPREGVGRPLRARPQGALHHSGPAGAVEPADLSAPRRRHGERHPLHFAGLTPSLGTPCARAPAQTRVYCVSRGRAHACAE